MAKSLGETDKVIASEHEVDNTQAEVDALEFAAELLERGLLAA